MKQVYGVDLTLNCSKPFVATGSMRPNSALSPDGPSNFYDAVRTAIHPESRDRGALIAMNDHIVSAFYATKTNGNTVSTFQSIDQGYLAQFMSGQPYYFFDPALPKGRPYFNPFNLTSPLPKVVVLYGHRKLLNLASYLPQSPLLTFLQRASNLASCTPLPKTAPSKCNSHIEPHFF